MDTSNPFLFADDTGMTIKGSDSHESSNTINNCIIDINSWFISYVLYLNIDKTRFIQFLMKNSKLTGLSISFENKHVMKVQKIKFLVITIDNYVMEFPYRRNNTQIK